MCAGRQCLLLTLLVCPRAPPSSNPEQPRLAGHAVDLALAFVHRLLLLARVRVRGFELVPDGPQLPGASLPGLPFAKTAGCRFLADCFINLLAYPVQNNRAIGLEFVDVHSPRIALI